MSPTKSISSSSDLFPHMHPTLDAFIRVADGRELGEDLGEGPLNRKSGFPGTRAIYMPLTYRVLSFVYTPDTCFMQPYTPGQCPICKPHPARLELLVKDF